MPQASSAALKDIIRYLKMKIVELNVYETILLCLWSMMICCQRILHVFTGDLDGLPELELDESTFYLTASAETLEEHCKLAEHDGALVKRNGGSVDCGTLLRSTLDEIFVAHIWPRVMEIPYPSWFSVWRSVNKTWFRFIATTMEWNTLLIVRATEIQYENHLNQTGEPRLGYTARVAREIDLLKTMLVLDHQERLESKRTDPSRRCFLSL
ncbi:hypothetical protein R1sor_014046 [Riccia sorocarpa]|uniref:Uncharacterized protein n=1 Tax=Riccia sorocarpa TaxID=122646 RepID=A0ABD3H8A2_9MARC